MNGPRARRITGFKPAGRALFAWFRRDAPLEAYFGKTWPLPDIAKVK